MTLVTSIRVDSVTYSHTTETILDWLPRHESRYICFANVHMVMESFDSAGFRKIVNNADLVAPDGMPLVWMMRWKGQRSQQRVYRPLLMLHVLEAAVQQIFRLGFTGGKPEVLGALLNDAGALCEPECRLFV